jgi:hypothetical protein
MVHMLLFFMAGLSEGLRRYSFAARAAPRLLAPTCPFPSAAGTY